MKKNIYRKTNKVWSGCGKRLLRQLGVTAGLLLSFNSGLLAQANTKYGIDALFSVTTGSRNSAFGYQSLYSNTTGTFNSAFGYRSLYSNTSGAYNVANGSSALYSNTLGGCNIATGHQALYSNTLGEYNVAMGDEALYSNTLGQFNIATGHHALYSNTLGQYNIAIGIDALYFNKLGMFNIATGVSALYSNTIGAYNVATGAYALSSNTIGAYNVATGANALYFNTTGNYNSAFGRQSLYWNTEGYRNIATGAQALYFNTTGHNNSAFGFRSLYSNTTGAYNVATGNEALSFNTTGDYNTAIGYAADVSKGDLTNATAIGNGAIVDKSDKVVIGNTSVTEIGGKVSWSTFSDARFKKEINNNVHGLDFIMKLKPVTYKYDSKKMNDFFATKSKDDQLVKKSSEISSEDEATYTGFLAQEVQAAADAVNYDFSGIIKPIDDKTHYSLRYSDFVVPVVKGMQEQQDQIEALKQEIAELKKLISENVNHSNAKNGAAQQMEVSESKEVTLYPNPSTGIFTITTQEGITNGVMEVHDGKGKSIKKITFTTEVSGYKLDLSGYPTGVYILYIFSGDKTYTKKLIIE